MKPTVRRQLDRRDFFRSVGAATGVVAAATCLESPEAKAEAAAALVQSGASLADVVRVHYLLTRREDFEPIWPVLQKYLGEVRPACTVMVTGLVDERMLVEIEVTARKPG